MDKVRRVEYPCGSEILDLDSSPSYPSTESGVESGEDGGEGIAEESGSWLVGFDFLGGVKWGTDWSVCATRGWVRFFDIHVGGDIPFKAKARTVS